MAKVADKKPKKTVKKTVKPAHVEVETEVEPKEEASLEVVAEEVSEEKNGKKERYYEAVGRRKESVAIIRLYTKKSTDNLDGDYALIVVNDKDYRDYFTDKILQAIVESSLRKLKSTNRFKATVKVNGGGLSGQADAIKHGIARALVLFDQNFRKKLKKSGFLTRDPRVKERRKYGLKKARKAPGWSKR
jgi:small subunit ribosomal protein S9